MSKCNFLLPNWQPSPVPEAIDIIMLMGIESRHGNMLCQVLYPSVLIYADNTPRLPKHWLPKPVRFPILDGSLDASSALWWFNNPVDTSMAHLTRKKNVIADRISQVKKSLPFSHLFFPSCRTFPSWNPENISAPVQNLSCLLRTYCCRRAPPIHWKEAGKY